MKKKAGVWRGCFGLVLCAAVLQGGALLLTAGYRARMNLTFKTAPKQRKVTEEFKAGFEAGVKWGILSYMQNPAEDDVRKHIQAAEKWYWLVVVNNGRTLLEQAVQTNGIAEVDFCEVAPTNAGAGVQ